MQQHTVRDVPRLLEQLREQVQSETRKPVSAAVLKLSDAIEVASAQGDDEAPTHDGDWIDLGFTPAEARLVTYLKSKFGKAISRDALMSHLYGGNPDAPESSIISVLVSKINRKMARSPAPVRIEPIWGFGYRMVEGRHETKTIMAERNEWRDGVFMGPLQAKVANDLHYRLGKWVPTADLRARTGLGVPNVGTIMTALRKNLQGSRYIIENERRHGYRMTVKSN